MVCIVEPRFAFAVVFGPRLGDRWLYGCGLGECCRASLALLDELQNKCPT